MTDLKRDREESYNWSAFSGMVRGEREEKKEYSGKRLLELHSMNGKKK